MANETASTETAMPDITQLSLDEVRSLDDSVLAHSLRRFQRESAEARDPISAFGAFNQHGSSPW